MKVKNYFEYEQAGETVGYKSYVTDPGKRNIEIGEIRCRGIHINEKPEVTIKFNQALYRERYLEIIFHALAQCYRFCGKQNSQPLVLIEAANKEVEVEVEVILKTLYYMPYKNEAGKVEYILSGAVLQTPLCFKVEEKMAIVSDSRPIEEAVIKQIVVGLTRHITINGEIPKILLLDNQAPSKYASIIAKLNYFESENGGYEFV